MRAVVGLALGFAACGGQHTIGEKVDAAVVDSADARTLPAGCDYGELRDGTNDTVSSGGGSPELTGLVFASRSVLCGMIDHTHFDGDITVDVDAYRITVAADADVLVRISGAGAEAIELVGVDIYSGASFNVLVGAVTFYGNHGVTAVHLPAGEYELSAFALNSTAITASVAYKLDVVADVPATRCPAGTTGGYAEANDGASSNGNDVIALMSGTPPALTASTADMPEPTQLTIAPDNYRLRGSAADVATMDLYEDKDTFAFTTGATTNELSVRLDWTTSANLDYLLFEANSVEVVKRVNTMQVPEHETFSVKPSTAYWLLVGAKVSSTGLPAAYSATLCGAGFAP